ncbi:hypothetical protein ACO0QE_000398 [Hanseniaspora vineae]
MASKEELDHLVHEYIRQVPVSTIQSRSSSFDTWSFTKGLIIGQISVILVFIFFLRFFIFSDSRSPNPRNSLSIFSKLSKNSTIIKLGGKERVVEEELESDLEKKLHSILEKTYYDVDTHQPESLDWFNVLIAQTIQQFRLEALLKDNIVHSLNSFIEGKSQDIPDFIDSMKITELDIGDDFPIFSKCRIQYSPNSNKKRLEAKIDIDLSDRLAIGVQTKLLLNLPKPLSASLPVELTVSIVRFQACLCVSLTSGEEFVKANSINNPTFEFEDEASSGTDLGKDSKNSNPGLHESNEDDEHNGGYYLMFSFMPEYKMEFEVQSLIGARSKLENIPKISDVIEYQIKKWFVERCVEPRFQFVKLPSLWPRSKNTREEVVV